MKLATPTSFVVTLPPPTPNGGLHVGHLSGPFLSADAFSRAARLQGSKVFTSCYSDVNQSYVRVTALRQKRDPHELADHWTNDIVATLDEASIEVDDYFPVDGASRESVQRLFHDLYARGVLVKKPFPVFRSSLTGEFLDEAGVSGHCPKCLSQSKCGICESCSSVNDPSTLLNPSVTLTGEKTLRVEQVEVMVLELERFRQNIASVYERNPRFRPRFRWVVEDALKHKLPDFPVTMPGTWGFPVGHADFAGQVINAWPEIMAQQIYSYKRALVRDPSLGAQPAFVNFYGFDNAYFYAIVHAALMTIVDDGRWLPYGALNNEFYNLDHQKFSTSNNHAIWSRDLLKRHSTDAIRFYAAWNHPGFEKANFNEGDMVKVLDRGLRRLWGSIASQYNARIAGFEGPAGEASSAAVNVGRAALERIFDGYSLERFHLRQAAEDILHLMEYIEAQLRHGDAYLGDVAHLLRCLAVALVPIAPDAGGALHQNLAGAPAVRVDERHALYLCKLPLALFGERLPS
ncbi:MAG: class I tRNA ligase family protein [Rhizobacter sp.]